MKRHTMLLMGASLVLAFAPPVSAGIDPPLNTVHFDLTTAPLGIFGLEFTVDYVTTLAETENRRIVETRLHLEFNTENAAGSLADAADIAIQFQPPTVTVPIETFSGADFGWSGTGSFVGDLSTDVFNEPILDFSDIDPPPDFILWFARIINLDDLNPQLGGAFTNSYIEVDMVPIPEPTSMCLLASAAGLLLLRRKY
jgi:hypothetical protein